MKFSVFYAPPTKDTIEKILYNLRKKIPIFPISPREPELPFPFQPPEGIATCLKTSGTTGAPKFAMHSFENHLTNASNPHPLLELSSTDRWYLSLPLNHVGGLAILFRSFVSGMSVVLEKDDTITHLSFVPTQLKRYLQNPIHYPKLKAILLGGAPIPLELCKQAYKMGLPLFLTYGMTEMSSQIATHPFHPSTGVTFGFPLKERELKIAPDGEIWVRGKTLFQGYLGGPRISDWFPTRDIGEMGPNGLLIHGRKDRMIISGGENIHLEDIEKSLMNLPEVQDAKVTSRPDEEFGQRPLATITLSSPLCPEEIRERLSYDLPRFKIPHLSDIYIVLGNGENFNISKIMTN